MADVTRGKRLTGSARRRLAAELRKRYERGASIRSLAESTGRSPEFVRRMLAESGTTLRGRGSGAPHDKLGAARSDAHRLLDQVPEDKVRAAVELLRQLAEEAPSRTPRRHFRTVGVFDGEADLGRRTKEILRHELGSGHTQSA